MSQPGGLSIDAGAPADRSGRSTREEAGAEQNAMPFLVIENSMAPFEANDAEVQGSSPVLPDLLRARKETRWPEDVRDPVDKRMTSSRYVANP